MKRKEISEIEKDVLNLCDFWATDLLELSSGQIIWFLFEENISQYQYVMGYTVLYEGMIDNVNRLIYNKYNSQITFIDFKRMIAMMGAPNAYDIKGKYRWNSIYSKGLLENVANEIHKQFLINKGITKKCIVLDCDNVLWGGILSEDGIDNICIGYNGTGRIYQDFQRYILSLYRAGIIITICSKNDFSDVINVFRNHNEMVLQEKHVACFEVNWNDKAENILEIANKLNISLDSIVFIDDSPFEIEAVKLRLPQVTAIRYERYSIYQHLDCFNLQINDNVEEIEKRIETYRTNESRELLKKQYSEYKDYLEALEVKVEIHKTKDLELHRVAELSQRTNRRTNGKRYSIEQIRQRYMNSDINLYSVFVSDRYSDLGLVGCMEEEDGVLTLFSLSCRALGRNIEMNMLNFICQKHEISRFYWADTYQNEQIDYSGAL